MRLNGKRRCAPHCEGCAHKRVPVEAKRFVHRALVKSSRQHRSTVLCGCERLLGKLVQLRRVDRSAGGVGNSAVSGVGRHCSCVACGTSGRRRHSGSGSAAAARKVAQTPLLGPVFICVDCQRRSQQQHKNRHTANTTRTTTHTCRVGVPPLFVLSSLFLQFLRIDATSFLTCFCNVQPVVLHHALLLKPLAGLWFWTPLISPLGTAVQTLDHSVWLVHAFFK